jgi:proline iminopeptidase
VIIRELVNVGNAILEVLIDGAGGPVLCSTHPTMIARQPGTGRFSPFDVWAQHGTCVTVHPRGTGRSSPADSRHDLSMHRLADDLEQVRQHLGFERWVVGGFSAGGYVALLNAVAYPAALTGLVLMATAPSGRFRQDLDCLYNPARPDLTEIQAARTRAYAADATPADVRRWAELTYHRPDSVEARVASAAASDGNSTAAPVICPARVAAMQAELAGTDGYAPYDVTDRLGEIDAPTLIVGGRHDNSNPCRWSEVLHAGIPGSELVILEESGHFVHHEQPEQVEAALLAFMRRLSSD